jgi:glycosyltransferase involved in cell wall biosynthesis
VHLLHVTPYYRDAWGYGGIPRVATALCAGLAGRGHRVTVCTTDVRDSSSRTSGPAMRDRLRPGRAFLDHAGVEVHVFPNLSNTLAYRAQLFVPLGLRAFLRQEAGRFHLAHIHGHHHLPGSIAAAELRRAGVPHVITPNGTAPRIERRILAKWLFDVTLGRGVLAGAERIIAVSRAEQRQLERLGIPPTRIRVVHNPVEVDAFRVPRLRGAFRRRWGIPFKRFVLYLGQITPRKQVDLLVRAFARLATPELGLVIAGNDAGAAVRVRAAVRQLGLQARVLFTGQLEGQQRPEALHDADVVAYPGRDEIFGLVPLEALLCGTPVVVADDSGCGEVIRAVGGGLVVRQGDPAALAGALAAVLEGQPGWRKAAAEAGERVAQQFSPETIASGVERVYAELVGGP